MAKKYYRVNRGGLTVGNVVYREGDVLEIDSKEENLSRPARAFMQAVEKQGGHEFLEAIDGRSSEARRASAGLPTTTAPSGRAVAQVEEAEAEEEEDPLAEDEETDEE